MGFVSMQDSYVGNFSSDKKGSDAPESKAEKYLQDLPFLPTI